MKNLKILVVDDEIELRSLFSEELELSGAKTLQAENGIEALKILNKEKVDLVITDNNMPLMKGIDLIIEAKKFVNIPFILFVEDPTRVTEYQHANVDYFISKPLDFEALAMLIDSHFKIAR